MISRPLEDLPVELLLNILKFLPVKDVLGFGTTNSLYHSFAKDQAFWRFLFARDFPQGPTPKKDQTKIDYQDEYREQTKRYALINIDISSLRQAMVVFKNNYPEYKDMHFMLVFEKELFLKEIVIEKFLKTKQFSIDPDFRVAPKKQILGSLDRRADFSSYPYMVGITKAAEKKLTQDKESVLEEKDIISFLHGNGTETRKEVPQNPIPSLSSVSSTTFSPEKELKPVELVKHNSSCTIS